MKLAAMVAWTVGVPVALATGWVWLDEALFWGTIAFFWGWFLWGVLWDHDNDWQ